MKEKEICATCEFFEPEAYGGSCFDESEDGQRFLSAFTVGSSSCKHWEKKRSVGQDMPWDD